MLSKADVILELRVRAFCMGIVRLHCSWEVKEAALRCPLQNSDWRSTCHVSFEDKWTSCSLWAGERGDFQVNLCLLKCCRSIIHLVASNGDWANREVSCHIYRLEKGLTRIHKVVSVDNLLTDWGRESEGDSCRGWDLLTVERDKGASVVQVLRLLETQMARDFLSNISKCHNWNTWRGKGSQYP